MKYFSHLNSAIHIIRLYDGRHPFHHFIKSYFREHKKIGSRDRKNISQLCYNYFRLGNGFPSLSVEEKMLAGLFFCSNQSNELLENLKPGWNHQAAISLPEKMQVSGLSISPQEIFPCLNEVSPSILRDEFALSHFQQPDLFIRIRPGKEPIVKQKLEAAAVNYVEVSPSCVSFSNNTPVDRILELDLEAVVQDYSSQQTGEFLIEVKEKFHNRSIKVWDACSGSGGKSILAFDILKKIDLTISDIRPSILKNLEERLSRADIRNYRSEVRDLSKTPYDSMSEQFDLIIADVPCSGSGTWGRTPEQLKYFDTKQIEVFSELQKRIVSNISRQVNSGGCLLYITCSVFEKENELVVDHLVKETGMQLKKVQVLEGYRKKADTMFAALLTT